jgi:CheY-like chemotaxis protein
MIDMTNAAAIEILLVEDNPGDARLTEEAFTDGRLLNNMHRVSDGVEAIAYLRNEGQYKAMPRPDIVLLDLNMPRKDGREVLAEIKEDADLKSIPVVVLTTSDADVDVMKSYQLHANCYITKPVELDKFMEIVQRIEDFWLAIVRLPRQAA